MPAPASLTVRRHEGGVRIAVSGELDLLTAPELAAALKRHRFAGDAVVLDLSRLDFMDSSGIAVLVEASRLAPDTLRFVEPADQPRRALELCGLLDRLPWADGA